MPRTCMTCLESSMNIICTSAHAEIVCVDAVAGEFIEHVQGVPTVVAGPRGSRR
jgi:hypothetical protein